jgi:hypothetical protein
MGSSQGDGFAIITSVLLMSAMAMSPFFSPRSSTADPVVDGESSDQTGREKRLNLFVVLSAIVEGGIHSHLRPDVMIHLVLERGVEGNGMPDLTNSAYRDAYAEGGLHVEPPESFAGRNRWCDGRKEEPPRCPRWRSWCTPLRADGGLSTSAASRRYPGPEYPHYAGLILCTSWIGGYREAHPWSMKFLSRRAAGVRAGHSRLRSAGRAFVIEGSLSRHLHTHKV